MSQDNTPDALALALKAGDLQALRALMDGFGEGILSFVYRHVLDLEDARELTQETFVRVHRHIHQWEPRAPFKAWLFRVALNLCRDHLKSRGHREKRRTLSLDVAVDVESNRGTPAVDDGLMMKDDLRHLESLIAALPQKLREPLILQALEGLSAQETAAVLSISVRAAETRLYRARAALRSRWDGSAE